MSYKYMLETLNQVDVLKPGLHPKFSSVMFMLDNSIYNRYDSCRMIDSI